MPSSTPMELFPAPAATGARHDRRPVDSRADQLEFTLTVHTPFDALASALLDRTAEMFDLHLGMTLGEYQNRWHEIVEVAEDVTAQARAESTRLHRLAREKGPGWRRWQAQAREVDGFIAGVFNAAGEWYINASEPLLATYEARFPDDEWFGIVLADYRACEAYGRLTLQQIIDLGDGIAPGPLDR